MKHLLTLAALLVSTLSLAQQMPYNPDANGDNFVGVDDVLGVLGVYDTALMQPDLTCDYEGTDLEQLFGGLMNQNLVLDSVYVEYYLVDSVASFSPECPDPLVEEVVLQRSFILYPYYSDFGIQESVINAGTTFLDYFRRIDIVYNYLEGSFRFSAFDQEIGTLTSYYAYSYSHPNPFQLPFPEGFELNEEGIQCDWDDADWADNCQSLKIIPFWHEAE